MPDTVLRERTLPHNLEAERSVLGAVLLHNDAFNLAAEVVDSNDFYRDAHRIMLKLEETMDRIDKMATTWDDRVATFELSPERLDRIEQALFNIERGMMGVEASMSALPRALRTRIDRGRKPTAGRTPPREPY